MWMRQAVLCLDGIDFDAQLAMTWFSRNSLSRRHTHTHTTQTHEHMNTWRACSGSITRSVSCVSSNTCMSLDSIFDLKYGKEERRKERKRVESSRGLRKTPGKRSEREKEKRTKLRPTDRRRFTSCISLT